MKNNGYDFGVVKALRGRFKLTLEKLAVKSGLTYTTVENIETNKTMPSLKTLDALANALEISVSDLIALSEKKVVQIRDSKVLADISGQIPDLNKKPVVKLASFEKAKVFIVNALEGQSIKAPELHDDCYEMCVVTKGEVELIMDDEIYNLKSDQVVLFDGTVPHTFEQVVDGQFTTFHIPKKCNAIKMLLQDREP